MAGGINYTPGSYAFNHVITVAEFATEVTTAMTNLQGPWTSFTPALTASTTNPTLGTGNSLTGSWYRVGKTITGIADVVFGTPGFVAGSGNYAVSLPTASTAGVITTGSIAGSGVFFDSSAGKFYDLTLIFVTTTTVRLVEATTGAFLSATSPVVPANGDRINYEFYYQSA